MAIFNRRSRTAASTSSEKIATRTIDKYVVVAVAGQSNSVGYDESQWNSDYDNKNPDRIKQLGYYGANNLQIIPLTQCAENLQNMSDTADSIHAPFGGGVTRKGTKGIHLPLATELLKYIPEDYGILIVPVAYGNTGFSQGDNLEYDDATKKPTNTTDPQNGNWSLEGAYYKTLRDRVKHCLDLNSENKFLGVIWCQGERDGNSQVEALKTGFQALVEQLAQDWEAYKSRTINNKVDKSIWFIYESVLYWRTGTGNSGNCWKWYKGYVGEDHYIAIEPKNDYTNNVNGGEKRTSSTFTSHYGNDAFVKVVAPAVANKLVSSKAIPLMDNQLQYGYASNDKRIFIDRDFNTFNNVVYIDAETNNIEFVKSGNVTSMTALLLKPNVKEIKINNIKEGMIILLEYTKDGKYSGLLFNNKDEGSSSSNYTTVRGISETKRLDNGSWDKHNITNNLGITANNFTEGTVTIQSVSRGVFKFKYNDADWFTYDLTTNSTSLVNNGVSSEEIIYAIGFQYGWSGSQPTSTIGTIESIVAEDAVSPALTSETTEVNASGTLDLVYSKSAYDKLEITNESSQGSFTIETAEDDKSVTVHYTAPAVASDTEVALKVKAKNLYGATDSEEITTNITVKGSGVEVTKPAKPILVEDQTLEVVESKSIEIKFTIEEGSVLEATVPDSKGSAEYKAGSSGTEGIITYTAPAVEADEAVTLNVIAKKDSQSSEGLEVSVTVKDKKEEEAITLTLSKEEVEIKETAQDEVTVTTNASDWSITNNNQELFTATKETGKIVILGVKKGSGTITVSTAGNAIVRNGVTKTINVNVLEQNGEIVTSLTVDPTGPLTLKEGEEQVFTVDTNAETFTMESSSPDNVTVDLEAKKITAIKEGNAEITFKARAEGGDEKTVKVSVTVTKEEEIVPPEPEEKLSDEEIKNILEKPDFDYKTDIVEIGKNSPLKYVTQLSIIKTYVDIVSIKRSILPIETLAKESYNLYYVIRDVLDDVKGNEDKFNNLLNIASKMFYRYKDEATSKELLVRGSDNWIKLGLTNDKKDVYTYVNLFGLIAILSDEAKRDENKAKIKFDEVFAEDKVNLDSEFIAALKKFYKFA